MTYIAIIIIVLLLHYIIYMYIVINYIVTSCHIYAAHVNQTRNSLKLARIHGRNMYKLLIINVKT